MYEHSNRLEILKANQIISVTDENSVEKKGKVATKH